MLKLLLVGPFPPPHGGVSVHVLILQELLLKSGIPCRVLNISRVAPTSDRYVSVRGPFHFIFQLLRHSLKGWSFHVHISGHNRKSWLVALVAGLVGVTGPGTTLTIHSGMSPAYISSRRSRRFLARTASMFYRNIIAVNSEIKESLCSLSVPGSKIEVLPAFLQSAPSNRAIPDNFESWSGKHHPVISTALFFRPEYGFGLLVQAVSELRRKHPRVGCVVMGDSESRLQGEKLVCEHGLQQHIVTLGDVTHESCLAVIARSDVFVRSTLSDGDAISVREALMLGTAVVASDVVRRPAGTICFKTGDAYDLASKIDTLLSETAPPRDVCVTPGEEGIHRLLELYGPSAGRA